MCGGMSTLKHDFSVLSHHTLVNIDAGQCQSVLTFAHAARTCTRVPAQLPSVDMSDLL